MANRPVSGCPIASRNHLGGLHRELRSPRTSAISPAAGSKHAVLLAAHKWPSAAMTHPGFSYPSGHSIYTGLSNGAFNPDAVLTSN
ncbi:unnamed protein product [Vitrella brassicaformis CCMP3155]|uniref:Uncharacterized protein n=1 Tax=Vitrella brassicaformis (strain CCMP3155) TaxID=1169540 RepID=A0A0G4F2C3_VITBC|nr:unnamed protein product [Vitrella brassicaformis CCMP3155]|eukprot:CEM05519.1 unnamed protein product [Vitrella brassicaformis CCMP3155]